MSKSLVAAASVARAPPPVQSIFRSSSFCSSFSSTGYWAFLDACPLLTPPLPFWWSLAALCESSSLDALPPPVAVTSPPSPFLAENLGVLGVLSVLWFPPFCCSYFCFLIFKASLWWYLVPLARLPPGALLLFPPTAPLLLSDEESPPLDLLSREAEVGTCCGGYYPFWMTMALRARLTRLWTPLRRWMLSFSWQIRSIELRRLLVLRA